MILPPISAAFVSQDGKVQLPTRLSNLIQFFILCLFQKNNVFFFRRRKKSMFNRKKTFYPTESFDFRRNNNFSTQRNRAEKPTRKTQSFTRQATKATIT
ncbi:MAG: hypothetical protein D3922_07345 [Candidatus Electrothrix sp. AR1]|nr:hypothetical protein [Candidatus Electrothrix sp. AR1]